MSVLAPPRIRPRTRVVPPPVPDPEVWDLAPDELCHPALPALAERIAMDERRARAFAERAKGRRRARVARDAAKGLALIVMLTVVTFGLLIFLAPVVLASSGLMGCGGG